MSVEVRILGEHDASVLRRVAADVLDDPVQQAWAREFLTDARHHLEDVEAVMWDGTTSRLCREPWPFTTLCPSTEPGTEMRREVVRSDALEQRTTDPVRLNDPWVERIGDAG